MSTALRADYTLNGSPLIFNVDLDTSTYKTSFRAGLQRAFNYAPSSAGNTLSANGTSGVHVYFDAALSGTGAWASTDYSTYIRINPDAKNYSSTIVDRLLQRLAAHELLHIMYAAHDRHDLGADYLMGDLNESDVSANSFAIGLSSCERDYITNTLYGSDPPPENPEGNNSPIILDALGNGLVLTAPRVWFDLKNSGTPQLMGATTRSWSLTAMETVQSTTVLSSSGTRQS